MKKTILLIIAVGVIVVILIILALLAGSKKTQQGTSSVSPTPVQEPQITFNQLPITIEKTDPANNQTNISVDQHITITFNRSFSPQEISFNSWPLFSYSTQVQGKNLIIIPKEKLKSNTIYNYNINYAAPIAADSFTFSTVGINPTAPSTYVRTGSPQDPYHGVESPDLYLSNHTPYSTDSFSITNDFTSTPNDHFYFTVLLKGTDQDQDKQDVINWLKSLGFSDSNIQSLDLRYLQSSPGNEAIPNSAQ